MSKNILKNEPIYPRFDVSQPSSNNKVYSITTTDLAIPSRSLTAGFITRILSQEGPMSSEFSVYGGESDGYEFGYKCSFSNVFTTYANLIKKDIIVLKASESITLSGSDFFRFISIKDYCSIPVYIELNGRIYPIYDCIIPNKERCYLMIDRASHHGPIRLFDHYLVIISYYYYSYGDDYKAYTFDSFFEANRFLLEQYEKYREWHYDKKPDETSNEWFAKRDEWDSIHIRIIAIEDFKLATCPEGFA